MALVLGSCQSLTDPSEFARNSTQESARAAAEKAVETASKDEEKTDGEKTADASEGDATADTKKQADETKTADASADKANDEAAKAEKAADPAPEKTTETAAKPDDGAKTETANGADGKATETAKALAAAENQPIVEATVEAPPEDDEPEAAAFQKPHRVEKMDSLPGVEWPEGIVLVSRSPEDDPSDFFTNGPMHPFSMRVPGVPASAVVAGNGLLLARSSIQVGCLKPQLISLVRRAEARFGKKVVITSGYRSPPYNRRVNGARNSQHMYCNAVDLYMPGVARDTLAKFFFAQSDRGGIGLYCHTQAIHVDIGRRRAWRWPCYRRQRS